ncbi:hypothetical protein GOODEAATRI_023118, partial [Goodea atripinnis]
GFRGRNRGTFFRGDSGPFVDEHSHDVEGGRNLPQFENIEDHKHYDPNFDRQRSPRSVGSSQERFRTSTARFSDREGTRGGHFQDNSRDSNYHEPRGSPNAMRYGNKGGPANYRGRGRGGYNQGRRGRSGPHRNQPRCQDLPQGEQREGCQPIRDDYKDPVEKVPNWKDENRLQQWRDSRSTSLEQNLRRDDLNPERPPQRKLGWNDPQTNNMMVITEETLTIKVDMSRPVNQNRMFHTSFNKELKRRTMPDISNDKNSNRRCGPGDRTSSKTRLQVELNPLCYSSDRQLSLDLVNVGRQRLDFLPLLEHSGTYRETATHTGAFAQEIITLGVSKQPLRGPGDLRHDLERRRQEKLEAVKVTIPGSSLSQCSQGSVRDPGGELIIEVIWAHNGKPISLETRDRTCTADLQVT